MEQGKKPKPTQVGLLGLVEYGWWKMAAGVPDLTPDRTAMETHIDSTSAFVVASSKHLASGPMIRSGPYALCQTAETGIACGTPTLTA